MRFPAISADGQLDLAARFFSAPGVGSRAECRRERAREVLRVLEADVDCDSRGRAFRFAEQAHREGEPLPEYLLVDARAELRAEGVVDRGVRVSEACDYVLRRNPLVQVSPYVDHRVRHPRRREREDFRGGALDDAARRMEDDVRRARRAFESRREHLPGAASERGRVGVDAREGRAGESREKDVVVDA